MLTDHRYYWYVGPSYWYSTVVVWLTRWAAGSIGIPPMEDPAFVSPSIYLLVSKLSCVRCIRRRRAHVHFVLYDNTGTSSRGGTWKTDHSILSTSRASRIYHWFARYSACPSLPIHLVHCCYPIYIYIYIHIHCFPATALFINKWMNREARPTSNVSAENENQRLPNLHNISSLSCSSVGWGTPRTVY